MDISDPVAVFTVTDPTEAEIVKNALESEGIRCFLDGDLQAAMPGLSAFEIQIMVDAGHADAARKLIAEHEARRER